MTQKIEILKKKIIYRCSYTGTKETDIIFKKIILKKINKLDVSELKNLLNLFETTLDAEIYSILIDKKEPLTKYQSLFNKLKND